MIIKKKMEKGYCVGFIFIAETKEDEKTIRAMRYRQIEPFIEVQNDVLCFLHLMKKLYKEKGKDTKFIESLIKVSEKKLISLIKRV